MKRRLIFVALCLLLGPRAGLAQPPIGVSGSQTYTSTGASTAIASLITQQSRHLIELQACATNNANVSICFATNNTCTATTTAYELAPGKMAPPLTVGMYTGIPGQQLAGSVMFNSDIAFIPASGTQCVHAFID